MKTLRKKTRPIAKDKTVVSRKNFDWKDELYVGDPKEDPTNKSEPVSVQETSNRIAELLGKWPLEKLAKEMAVGGYFDSDVFHMKGDKEAAIILWYCYNPDNSNLPQLFVAAEQVAKFTENDTPLTEPVNERLFRPIDTFVYDKQSNGSNDALALMRTSRTPGISTPQNMSKARVKEYVANFKIMMSTMQVLSGAKFSQFPYAAFANNEFYTAFESRPHKYVTYFFTLYFDTGHQPNYFRPILGLTGDDGKLVETKGTIGIKSIEPMLQKSWPPPPNEQ